MGTGLSDNIILRKNRLYANTIPYFPNDVKLLLRLYSTCLYSTSRSIPITTKRALSNS